MPRDQFSFLNLVDKPNFSSFNLMIVKTREIPSDGMNYTEHNFDILGFKPALHYL